MCKAIRRISICTLAAKVRQIEKVGLVLSGEVDLVPKDVEKSDVLTVVFFSGFTTRFHSQASQVSEPSGRVEGNPLGTSLLVEYDLLITSL